MRPAALRLGMLASLAGCATMQSFSARQELVHAPYYRTYAAFSLPEGAAIGHLPVELDYQAEVTGSARVLTPLLEAIDDYLGAAGWSTLLDAAPSSNAQAPWAYVGSAAGLNARTRLLADTAVRPVMVIQTLAPSRRWAEQLRTIADRHHVEAVLAIFLGPADYFLHQQRGTALGKELELGTGYATPVEWLDDPDQPVEVLHLTGLLLSRDGVVLRAGAEGIMAKRIASPLTEQDVVSALVSLRRDDLPGQPLAWRVALETLVRQLLVRSEGDRTFRRRAP